MKATYSDIETDPEVKARIEKGEDSTYTFLGITWDLLTNTILPNIYFNMTSQGWPNFGALLQIWGNCKFQIWGNAPNLGQKPIFNLEIEWENMLSASHNYSWTFLKPSSLFLCASLATTIKRHGNITKKHVLDSKNFSKYGKLTQIWSNFFDDDTLTQIWGNSPVIGKLHVLYGEKYSVYALKEKEFSFWGIIF